MRIWKYTLQDTWKQTIAMPLGAKILTAQMQEGKIVLWVLFDHDWRVSPEPLKKDRTFYMYVTEEPTDLDYQHYIATLQMGHLVVHLFERMA